MPKVTEEKVIEDMLGVESNHISGKFSCLFHTSVI
jgi:hypothetical protein